LVLLSKLTELMRERGGDRLERGLRDRNPDHAVSLASPPSIILSSSDRFLAGDNRFCALTSATSVTEESDGFAR
jgi:hypothetical protein